MRHEKSKLIANVNSRRWVSLMIFLMFSLMLKISACEEWWPLDGLPANYMPDRIRAADEILWVTPTYKRREYVVLKLPLEEVKDLLALFSSLKPGRRLTYLLDSEGAKDNGYLIFKNGKEIAGVFEIEAYKKEFVQWCGLLNHDENAMVFMLYGDILKGQALQASGDFRKKIVALADRVRNKDSKRIIVYRCWEALLPMSWHKRNNQTK